MRASLGRRWPTVVAFLVAALTGVAAVHWGTHAAGGSDSYGYVSQAYAWLDGGPPLDEPLVRQIGVREARWVASPLGWRPGLQSGELVPVYPPGLPWLMAAAMTVAGSAAAFSITPIFAVVAVACTYLLARQLSSPPVAAFAAVLLATNPTFVYQSFQPMSDVPVTGLWAACLVSLGGTRVWRWSAAGLLAALAILVRPNLAPLAVGAGLWGLTRLEGASRRPPALQDSAEAPSGRSDTRDGLGTDARGRVIVRVAVFALPVGVAVAVIAWTQAQWYGSAAMSGYGTAGMLFSLARIPGNAIRYTRWLLETNPVTAALVVASLVGGAWRRWPSPRGPALALLVFVALVSALYLPYLTFDAWWFTRFLLPAFPAGFSLAATALADLAERWRVPSAVVVVVCVGIAAGGLAIARSREAFRLRTVEARYAEAAHAVRRLLPANAIVLAMQHSGSVRFYSERPTLRWDVLRPADLDPLVGHRLPGLGLQAYAVLDPGEHVKFLERFAETGTVRRGEVGSMFVTKEGVHILKVGP